MTSNVVAPAPLTATIECATSNNLIFNNANYGDVLFYTSRSNQKILISTLQDGIPALTISSNNMIGVACCSPQASLHTGGNIICDGNVAFGQTLLDDARLVISSPGTGKACIAFTYNDLRVGDITSSPYGTMYSTTSDYRIKKVLDGIPHEALKKVMSIPVHTYIMKGADIPHVGCLAHEIQSVVPYVVNGMKDGPDIQTVDYSKLVPILIGAIQELNHKINATSDRE